MKEKFNNVFLLKFYKNHLLRMKYFPWLHNIYSLFRNMNLNIGRYLLEAIFENKIH